MESLVGKDFTSSRNVNHTANEVLLNGTSKNSNGQTKKPLHVYKYSNKGKGSLFEAVIVSGAPYFLTYNMTTKVINLESHIEKQNRIIYPPELDEYPYEPYEFKNKDDVRACLTLALKQNPDTLFKLIQNTVSQYNDQDEYKLNLISADIFRSYFQDRFSTTHYDILVGPPGSGKSSLGDTFGALAYRPVSMTDPTAANLYRLLGGVEQGQCTMILEEAERIDQCPDLMAVLKTGYSFNGRVARINMNTGKQEFFYSYGIKIIIGERSPHHNAKGVLDRSFVINCYRGDPKYDIKEILNPTDTGGSEHARHLDRLISLKNTLLMYRLIHHKDTIPDVDIGISGRDKELVKPSLQLFAATKSESKIVETLQKLLDLKNQRKENSFEWRLLSIIDELLSRTGFMPPFKLFWAQLVYDLEGETDEKRPNEYHSKDYGTIYRNTITNLLQDKFGAQTLHTKNGNVLIFDPDNISKLTKQHNRKISIKVINEFENGEGGEGGEPSILNKYYNDEFKADGRPSKSESITDNTLKSLISYKPTEPSQPSQPSTIPKLLKCPQCKFKNIHPETIEHHVKWAHNNGE